MGDFVGRLQQEDSAPGTCLPTALPSVTMGLRSRLKNRVRRILGQPSPAGPNPGPKAQPASPSRPSALRAVPSPSPSPPPAAVAPPAPAPAPATAPPAAEPSAEEAAEKAARHFERTRRAVLRFIDEQGGVADLAAMHDYSERKYFIGHRRFSDLMESLVDDELIDYDHGAGQAHLTAKGRTLGFTKMPGGRRRSA